MQTAIADQRPRLEQRGEESQIHVHIAGRECPVLWFLLDVTVFFFQVSY